MNHPDALLAEYVDGALAEGERPIIERHLDICERCQEEVALARAARSALASVAEAPAPGDLGDAAIAEARRRAAGAPAAVAHAEKPGWYRRAGAAAGIAGPSGAARPRDPGSVPRDAGDPRRLSDRPRGRPAGRHRPGPRGIEPRLHHPDVDAGHHLTSGLTSTQATT